MALKQSSKPKGKTGKRDDGAKPPACPKCGRPMTVKQVSPLLFAPNVDEMVYGCEDCGTQNKRTVRR